MVLLWSSDITVIHSHSSPYLRVGVVLAFFSNEKSFDSLENFQDALLSAASDSIDFTETGLLVRVCT